MRCHMWKDVTTLINCYQQPDEDMLRAVAEFTKPEPKGRLRRAGRGHKSYSHTNSHTPQIGKARHDRSRCRASLPLLGPSRRPPEVNQDSPDPEGPLYLPQLQQLAAVRASSCHRCWGLKDFTSDFAVLHSLKCRSWSQAIGAGCRDDAKPAGSACSGEPPPLFGDQGEESRV
jgi:hypothetical protein